MSGAHVMGGLAGLALVVALASDGAPGNDAWDGGGPADAEAATTGYALRVDGDDAWSVPEGRPPLPACDRTAPFAVGDASIRLPASGPVVPLATPDCALGVDRGGADAVRLLQQALAACNGQALDADGRYGPATRAAVRAVQQRHGIATDGVYGPQTRDAMAWPVVSGSEGGAGCAAPGAR